jgi:hypothetical protein
VVEARLAFDQLNSAAPQNSVEMWEASIQEAESARLPEDPTAMDVMHSQVTKGQTLKDIAAAILTEDRLSNTPAPDDGGTTDWILGGFQIEDEQ